MQYNQAWRSVVSSSEATNYTGSIEKLLVLTTGTISRIEFGDLNENPSSAVSASDWSAKGITGVISASAGTVIEGPIGRFKSSPGTCAGGNLLIYKK